MHKQLEMLPYVNIAPVVREDMTKANCFSIEGRPKYMKDGGMLHAIDLSLATTVHCRMSIDIWSHLQALKLTHILC